MKKFIALFVVLAFAGALLAGCPAPNNAPKANANAPTNNAPPANNG